MFKDFGKYRLVYAHLWAIYGRSWWIRTSYLLQFMSRLCKLIALPIAISLIIAKLSAHDYDGARNAVLLYVCFSLTLGILVPLVKYIGVRGENSAYGNATADYFARLVSADMSFFTANLSGYLTTATRQYVDSTLQLVRAIRDRYVTTLLSIVFPLVVIAWLDPWLGLVALGLSLVQAGYLLWASNVQGAFRVESRELYRANSGRMADVISNILAVRSNAQEQVYAKRVRVGAFEEAESFRRRYALQARLVGVREAITVCFFMVLLWLTVQRMSGGHIDLAAAVLVVTYTTTILTGVYALSDDLDQHDDFIDKIIPAFEVLDRKNVVTDPKHPKEIGRLQGEISLENVTFSYDKNDQKVFEQLSLHIPKGQKVGVVGLSGAGKSTLTKLLLRFEDVADGVIKVDGVDIRAMAQADLRRNIAYVPQEPLLFHSSIRENLMLADMHADDAQIIAALKAAHAYEFIAALSDGLDSIVGERGVKLSGGQKQRVAIARAVLRDAPIIILDEATSALDSESEQIIKDSFSDILQGRTAIVVAHRLSTLYEMDRIIVIQHGKIVEDGTHEQLVARKGAYARLWSRQQKHIDADIVG